MFVEMRETQTCQVYMKEANKPEDDRLHADKIKCSTADINRAGG